MAFGIGPALTTFSGHPAGWAAPSHPAGTDAPDATCKRQTLEPPDTFPNIGTTRLPLASKREGVPFAWTRDLQNAIGGRHGEKFYRIQRNKGAIRSSISWAKGSNPTGQRFLKDARSVIARAIKVASLEEIADLSAHLAKRVLGLWARFACGAGRFSGFDGTTTGFDNPKALAIARGSANSQASTQGCATPTAIGNSL